VRQQLRLAKPAEESHKQTGRARHNRSTVKLFPKCRNNDNCARTGIDEIGRAIGYAGAILFRCEQYLGGNEQPKQSRRGVAILRDRTCYIYEQADTTWAPSEDDDVLDIDLLPENATRLRALNEHNVAYFVA
jgi:hypothetical protein